MKKPIKYSLILLGTFLIMGLSIILALLSFYPLLGFGEQTKVIIDDSFKLMPGEIYRQGIGSIRGSENISILIENADNCEINFTLLTYGGVRYSNVSTANITYSFIAGADYYEASFLPNSTKPLFLNLQVFAQEPIVIYPFSWLANPAKVMFILSWLVVLLLFSKIGFCGFLKGIGNKPASLSLLNKKNTHKLQVIVLFSLFFWIVLVIMNSYPLATFENWYTDAARNSYSAVLFTKSGFSIFNSPLGQLAGSDNSPYMFVTWPEMPHLYPIGSLFLFLPFGLMLENGVAQSLVFKMEIIFFLVFSHVCLYYFIKRFWMQDFSRFLKGISLYFFYILLVVYSANGQFEAVSFVFSMLAIILFLEERYDFFLLLIAVSATFKYQAGIFLLPLILFSLLRIFQLSRPLVILKNKKILLAFALFGLNLFTAYLSLPFLINVRPNLVMNGINAFNPHAQIGWPLQVLLVLLTLIATLFSSIYLLKTNWLLSVFAVFVLLPLFTMPYFQPWYLPFFFIYLLIPRPKHSSRILIVWLIALVILLSFGGLSFNPIAFLENIWKVLNF
jgi:hypothetical protein